MKFSTIFSAAIAAGAVIAQDASPAAPTSEITSTVTTTITDSSRTTSTVSGTPVTDCGEGALCPTGRITSVRHVYTSTTTRVIPTLTVEEQVLPPQTVTKVEVVILSIPIATRGLCSTEVVSYHAEPKTEVITSTSTTTKYYVDTTYTTTTSVKEEYYTADEACLIRNMFTSPAGSTPAQSTPTSVPPPNPPQDQVPLGSPDADIDG